MQLGPTTPSNEPAQQATTNPAPAPGPDQGDPGAFSQTTTIQPPPTATGIEGWAQQLRAQSPLLPGILLVGGVVLMVLLMMRMLRRTTRNNSRRANSMGSPGERIAEIHDQARASMEPSRKLMVDAENIARRVGAALDNKAARLELLIEEADAKLEALNRALAGAQAKGAGNGEPSRHEPPPEPAGAPRTIDPTLLDRARVEQDLEERQSRVVGRISPEQPAPPAPASPAPSVVVPISQQVQDMAQSGMSSQEIAHHLDQPIGQVELILNLRKRAQQP